MSLRFPTLIALSCLMSVIALAAEPKRPETKIVPIAKVISELTDRLRANPKDAMAHYLLARVHTLAYAQSAQGVEVEASNGIPFLDPAKPYLPELTNRASHPAHLQAAFYHYNHAMITGYSPAPCKLGMVWSAEMTGRQRPMVIERFRKLRKEIIDTGFKGQFLTIARECTEHLIAMLDVKKDASEIASLKKWLKSLN